jgi:MFS family permease
MWLRPRQLSQEDRNILFFTADTAVQGLMMGGVFSFISVFLVRLGASNVETSLLTSLPAIVMVMTAIPAGQLVQRRTDLVRYTNLVRIFHRGSILVVALLPFFVRDQLVGLIIAVWTLKAFTNSLLNTSWMSVVAEVVPPSRRAQVNGTRWTILSIVTAFATALFGLLLDRLPFPLNYQVVFVISFAGGVTGMVFWSRLRLTNHVQFKKQKTTSKSVGQQISSYWRSLQVPAFVRYELAVSVLRLGLNLPTALYSIYWIRQLDASDLWIGWRTTAYQLALIVGYPFWGRMVTRRGRLVPFLICILGVGVYPLLTALVPDQVWLPVIAVVPGFFITGINLSMFDTVLAVSPPDRRPSFLAVDTMLSSLMIFVAPLIGSFLSDRIAIQGVLYLTGAVHLGAAGLFWTMGRGPRSEEGAAPRTD